MKEAFEQWYLTNRSYLDNRRSLFDTDELGYVDERVWECFEAWKTAWGMSKNGTT